MLNLHHRDIFTVLCEDLIANVKEETNQKKLVKEILNRFEKWKSLFNKIRPDGLNGEEQRGLYGELYFLRKLLSTNNFDYSEVIDSWGGSEKKVQDFQSKKWAVEVKTSHGKNHQKVHISNERQLDSSNLEDLFLYHISLEVMQKSGESLNDIIDEIRLFLQANIIAFNQFNNKLVQAGYFSFQKDFYENIGYNIRQDTFYKVVNDFPRIQESDIMNGVGDVKYSIILSQCKPFIVDVQEVFDKKVIG
ncbi:PD-(D/E)XK motif protein [Flavobacterium sp. CS20]|uniref:PD-(D/E)XK motif protein n=1 Tax=Flavobacterium sp. CS20 TaxID=2775246 RepID=UPI001B3A58A2|nr:PD-(D/E)XK motif protein [Flavobacterium sp. CS20]QTY25965.1 PD-(D/E)XK motif protein [Flavobacterium sp. CS20]